MCGYRCLVLRTSVQRAFACACLCRNHVCAVCVFAPVALRSLSYVDGAELLYAASAYTCHVGIGDVKALALVPTRAASEAVRRGRR